MTLILYIYHAIMLLEGFHSTFLCNVAWFMQGWAALQGCSTSPLKALRNGLAACKIQAHASCWTQILCVRRPRRHRQEIHGHVTLFQATYMCCPVRVPHHPPRRGKVRHVPLNDPFNFVLSLLDDEEALHAEGERFFWSPIINKVLKLEC